MVYSLIGQRLLIPKVTGKTRVTITVGQDRARKQVTVLIKGNVFIAQKGSPAPCCHAGTIPSWQAQPDLLRPRCIVLPAPQHALPRLGVVWLSGTFTRTAPRRLRVTNRAS